MGAYYDKLRAVREAFENGSGLQSQGGFGGGSSNFADHSNLSNIDADNTATAISFDDGDANALAVQNIEVNQNDK